MKKTLFILAGVLIAGLIVAFFVPYSRDQLLLRFHDIQFDNPPVHSKSRIEERLREFETVKMEDLNPDYLKWTGSSQAKYAKLLQGAEFHVVRRSDFYKRIVGNFRIRDFVCRDSIYHHCLFHKEESYYWLIDKDLLFAVLDLQEALDQRGYDPEGFWIRSGHRHPRKNQQVKGAGMSHHMLGEAIDMVIMDVNRDGAYTSEDKEIVISIAESEVIGDRGGIGKYPGTRSVHIDVRGHRARWDSY